MSNRHYYAAFHTYSIRFTNDVAYIVRFDTRAARDEYVNLEQWDGSNYHRESVTAAKARSLAPNAFKVCDFGRCMFDWVDDGTPGEFFEISAF